MASWTYVSRMPGRPEQTSSTSSSKTAVFSSARDARAAMHGLEIVSFQERETGASPTLAQFEAWCRENPFR